MAFSYLEFPVGRNVELLAAEDTKIKIKCCVWEIIRLVLFVVEKRETFCDLEYISIAIE